MLSPGQNSKRCKSCKKGEEGYLLVGVIFFLALVLIGLSVAAAKMTIEIQRDKEEEFYHRGMQYTRAIRMYYKKFGRYPTSVQQLESTNNMRFLRKRYKDPFTGKDEWRIIHLGENKVKIAGLFGQPLPTANGTTSSGITASSMGGGATTGTTSGSSSSGSMLSSGGSSLGSSSIGSSFGSSLSASSGTTNSTIGGGPIIGVSSTSTKTSLREYKKQKHYNEWEFVYDPLAEQLLGGSKANMQGGLPGSSGSTTLTSGSPNPL